MKIKKLILVLLLAALARAGAIYTVTVLPNGYGWSGLNNNGEAVGYSGNTIATWSAGAGLQTQANPVGTAGGSTLVVNDNGVVGGSAYNGSFSQAIIGNSALGLGGMLNDYGVALNNAGQLAGYAATSGGSTEAFIATASGGYQFLPILGDLFVGINASGVAVGYSGNSMIYGTASGVSSILPFGWAYTLGLGINASGDICGWGESTGGVSAFFYNPTTSTMVAVPGVGVVGTGCINDNNQVVGTVSFADGYGVIWDPVNGTQLLNNLVPTGWSILGPIDINDNGQILANAFYNNGSVEAVLLTESVPEPAAIGLAAAGIAALALRGVVRRRKGWGQPACFPE
jgi:hypothetical protein